MRRSSPRFRHHVGALLAACLVLMSGFASAPPPPVEDEAPSLLVRAPEIPLAALASTSPVRVEKQVQSQRISLLKPERSARSLSAAQRVTAPQPPNAAHRTYRDLPRRPLPTKQTTPRAPNDPGH